ncbi:hypothetical protein CDAR_290411 [Caerostris darwini]|uniref:Uncharacterized protein n=1 Tax=Caerostris darwini TaxID=1538125 RepID=A0AAV4N4J4_9ARAC|nr:hypothetical protein CDAR_290411 [Caerostris darwini]
MNLIAIHYGGLPIPASSQQHSKNGSKVKGKKSLTGGIHLGREWSDHSLPPKVKQPHPLWNSNPFCRPPTHRTALLLLVRVFAESAAPGLFFFFILLRKWILNFQTVCLSSKGRNNNYLLEVFLI